MKEGDLNFYTEFTDLRVNYNVIFLDEIIVVVCKWYYSLLWGTNMMRFASEITDLKMYFQMPLTVNGTPYNKSTF